MSSIPPAPLSKLGRKGEEPPATGHPYKLFPKHSPSPPTHSLDGGAVVMTVL